MIFILLAIIFTTSLFTCFKLFPRFGIDTFHAVLVNYFVAALTCYLLVDKSFVVKPSDSWFKFSALIGLLFILTFMATSFATQNVSLIISMIASKMSIVIPLSYAVLFIGEQMNYLKLSAIVLAMAGVVLTVLQVGHERKVIELNTKAVLLISMVFLGSGLVDTSFKFIEFNFYGTVPIQFTMLVCYASAAICGMIYFAFKHFKKIPKIKYRSIFAGIILGLLNYLSFYFVLLALHNPSLPSTIVFPLINVGVLLLSTFIAMAFFHERLRTINYIGVIISICSIIILAIQQYAFQP